MLKNNIEVVEAFILDSKQRLGGSTKRPLKPKDPDGHEVLRNQNSIPGSLTLHLELPIQNPHLHFDIGIPCALSTLRKEVRWTWQVGYM